MAKTFFWKGDSGLACWQLGLEIRITLLQFLCSKAHSSLPIFLLISMRNIFLFRITQVRIDQLKLLLLCYYCFEKVQTMTIFGFIHETMWLFHKLEVHIVLNWTILI